MRRIVLLLFVSIILSTYLFSQSDFTPGYILKSETDTIRGLLKNNTDITNTKYCEFKQNEKAAVQLFAPNQITGYRFFNGKNYISKGIEFGSNEKKMFVEFLVEGKVNLYFYRDFLGNHYLLHKRGIPIKEISQSNELIQRNDTVLQRKILIKRGLVQYFLQDCPQLFPEIEKLTFCTHENLIQLLLKYHNLACPNDMCILYVKESPVIKFYIQSTVDIFNALSLLSFGNTYDSGFGWYRTTTIGVLGGMSMPLTNEKLYFRTGFIFSRVYTNPESNIYKLPLEFQYNDDTKRVSPTFGLGLNLIYTKYIPFAVHPTMNVGINANITKRIFVSFFTDLEYLSSFQYLELGHAVKLSLGYRL